MSSAGIESGLGLKLRWYLKHAAAEKKSTSLQTAKVQEASEAKAEPAIPVPKFSGSARNSEPASLGALRSTISKVYSANIKQQPSELDLLLLFLSGLGTKRLNQLAKPNLKKAAHL